MDSEGGRGPALGRQQSTAMSPLDGSWVPCLGPWLRVQQATRPPAAFSARCPAPSPREQVTAPNTGNNGLRPPPASPSAQNTGSRLQNGSSVPAPTPGGGHAAVAAPHSPAAPASQWHGNRFLKPQAAGRTPSLIKALDHLTTPRRKAGRREAKHPTILPKQRGNQC